VLPDGWADDGARDGDPSVGLPVGVGDADDEFGAGLLDRLRGLEDDGVGRGEDEVRVGVADRDALAGSPPPVPDPPPTALEGRTAK
jgi:hypothetical protein